MSRENSSTEVLSQKSHDGRPLKSVVSRDGPCSERNERCGSQDSLQHTKSIAMHEYAQGNATLGLRAAKRTADKFANQREDISVESLVAKVVVDGPSQTRREQRKPSQLQTPPQDPMLSLPRPKHLESTNVTSLK